MVLSERVLWKNIRLTRDDQERTGQPMRECLLTEINDALVEADFKVGSGEYEVIIRRKATTSG